MLYLADGSLLDGVDRADQTAYAVYDPDSGKWSGWNILEMPADPKFNFSRSACAQWVIEANGDPASLYFGPNAREDFSVTVARLFLRRHDIEVH